MDCILDLVTDVEHEQTLEKSQSPCFQTIVADRVQWDTLMFYKDFIDQLCEAAYVIELRTF